MKRIALQPRTDWQTKVESCGLSFHTADSVPYWDESACYAFTTRQVDELEAATNTLQELCVQAAEHIIKTHAWDRLRIPASFVELIMKSWERDDPSLYGRFDLCYDGAQPPKLLEYNADTPTSLIEAAVAQWFWLEEVFPGRDQFNSIHERLIARWKEIQPGGALYFACIKDHEEDLRTVEYLMDTAVQAGIDARRIFVEDIGWRDDRFVDLDEQRIDTLFKLYPWEWMINEEFGSCLLFEPVRLIEPAWKMLLSNKGILPVLWELFPEHPNLLPAFDSPERLGRDFVKKPRLSREGANITVQSGLRSQSTAGDYGEEGFIYQQFCPLPCFDGNYAVVGSWIVAGESAGMGIREDTQLVTGNLSRFVPHYFQ